MHVILAGYELAEAERGEAALLAQQYARRVTEQGAQRRRAEVPEVPGPAVRLELRLE